MPAEAGTAGRGGEKCSPGHSKEVAVGGSTRSARGPEYPRARLVSLLVDCRTQMADVFTDRGQAERAGDTLSPLIEETDDEVPADARARVYHSLARATWMSLDWNRTRTLVEQAMEHYGRAGDRRGQAAMLNVLGAIVHEPRGDLERAFNAYGRALELVEGEPASPQLLLYRVNRDHALAELGQTPEAIAGLEGTVSLARQWGLGKVLTLATLFLGEAYLDAGQVADALATLSPGDVIRARTVTVSGTAEPGATVRLRLDGTRVAESPADASGRFLVEGVAVPEGDHAFTARAAD